MDDIRLYKEGSRYLLINMPEMLSKESFDHILTLLAEEGADDVFLSSDNPLCAKINGTVHRMSHRYLSDYEVAEILRAVHMESTPGRLASDDADFAYQVPVSEHKSWRFRCNGTGIVGPMGTSNGLAFTLRSIPARPPTMDQLGVPQEIREMVFPDNGIVIVTGPTGSGKTTLLASFIDHAATQQDGKHIIVYESPPEFDYHSIPNQTGLVDVSEVGVGGHLRSWPKAIRNSLRRNPDIIVCGEARDAETIEGALDASMTGHLVFTTAHTNQVAPTILRMANVFAEGDRHKVVDSLISNVRGIIHQRLVRTPDGNGRTPILEWLGFDGTIRDALYKTEINQLTSAINHFVVERGRPLGADLAEKYEAGRVCDEDCIRIAQELTHEP